MSPTATLGSIGVLSDESTHFLCFNSDKDAFKFEGGAEDTRLSHLKVQITKPLHLHVQHRDARVPNIFNECCIHFPETLFSSSRHWVLIIGFPDPFSIYPRVEAVSEKGVVRLFQNVTIERCEMSSEDSSTDRKVHYSVR